MSAHAKIFFIFCLGMVDLFAQENNSAFPLLLKEPFSMPFEETLDSTKIEGNIWVYDDKEVTLDSGFEKIGNIKVFKAHSPSSQAILGNKIIHQSQKLELEPSIQ